MQLYEKFCCLTFPRKSTKSPTALIVATRRAFSTRITKASRADVQKLVLLMAVAAYAFWEITTEVRQLQ